MTKKKRQEIIDQLIEEIDNWTIAELLDYAKHNRLGDLIELTDEELLEEV